MNFNMWSVLMSPSLPSSPCPIHGMNWANWCWGIPLYILIGGSTAWGWRTVVVYWVTSSQDCISRTTENSMVPRTFLMAVISPDLYSLYGSGPTDIAKLLDSPQISESQTMSFWSVAQRNFERLNWWQKTLKAGKGENMGIHWSFPA